jgi:hypothetical protein
MARKRGKSSEKNARAIANRCETGEREVRYFHVSPVFIHFSPSVSNRLIGAKQEKARNAPLMHVLWCRRSLSPLSIFYFLKKAKNVFPIHNPRFARPLVSLLLIFSCCPPFLCFVLFSLTTDRNWRF